MGAGERGCVDLADVGTLSTEHLGHLCVCVCDVGDVQRVNSVTLEMHARMFHRWGDHFTHLACSRDIACTPLSHTDRHSIK